MDIDAIDMKVHKLMAFMEEHHDVLTWLKEHPGFLNANRIGRLATQVSNHDASLVELSAKVAQHGDTLDQLSKFPNPNSPETGDRPEGEAEELVSEEKDDDPKSKSKS